MLGGSQTPDLGTFWKHRTACLGIVIALHDAARVVVGPTYFRERDVLMGNRCGSQIPTWATYFR